MARSLARRLRPAHGWCNRDTRLRAPLRILVPPPDSAYSRSRPRLPTLMLRVMDARVARFLWLGPGRQQCKEGFTRFRPAQGSCNRDVASNPRAATYFIALFEEPATAPRFDAPRKWMRGSPASYGFAQEDSS